MFELPPPLLQHVILFDTNNIGQHGIAIFNKLCHILAFKMPVVIVNCVDGPQFGIGYNVLISKPDFEIRTKKIIDNFAARHFNNYVCYINSQTNKYRGALVYLTDILGTDKNFVVFGNNLYKCITPQLLLTIGQNNLKTIIDTQNGRFIDGENIFEVQQYFDIVT